MTADSPPPPRIGWVRSLAALGALNGLLAVALAAAGAHALAPRFVERGAAWFALAGQFHMAHALALFAAAWMCERYPRSRLAPLAGCCFLAGIVLFSGSLYFRAVGGEGWFAHAAPLGGSAWLVGWLALALAAWI